MLRVDFNQKFVDHKSILVFVKKLGAISEAEFSQLFEDLSQLHTVQLPDTRTVHLRYTRYISHQFTEWGSFHVHKKLLGILSIAKLLDDDLSGIKTAHESLKSWYGNTALDSRCFILGSENISEDEKKREREFVFLKQEDIMTKIGKQVAEFAMSLFLILEGKRTEKSMEKPDKFTFLRSPLDVEIPVDVESRNRKQCIGRMKKYIGDLCLVGGVPEEAIFHYSVAIDLLRSVGDLLWMAGSLEGMCAASLLCRTEHKIISPSERPSLQLDISKLSTTGPVNGNDGEEFRMASIIPLTDIEIVEKSEEIFQVYEKYKESKVLAIEARFKYARFFLSKKRYRDVSIALQDVLTIELTYKLSDAEKIQLHSAMAMLYDDIGYMRKAAFFTRKAARHCTSQHLPPQGWTASYNLMRNALEGYKIHFQTDTPENEEGWPDLKIQLIKELIDMSKELQNSNIPIRHIAYLLQTMHCHISELDVQELINTLEKFQKTKSPQDQFSLVDDLVLSNGDVLPPVALTDLPVVRDLKVNALASHLRPIVSPSSPSPVKTPFIFSTLNKGPRKSKKANPVVRWVEGDIGEVAMQVYNPMPFEIKISKMTLLTQGLPFQAFPSTLGLSNDNMSHPFMLLGIPEEPGQLEITGYSVELSGIQSKCPITRTILDKQFELPLIVQVTPAMPLLQFHSAINTVKSFVNSSHRGSSLTLDVTLYHGQSISGPIVVENVGKIPVQNLTISLLSTFKSDKVLVTLDPEHVTQSLPLSATTTSHFNLTFHGHLPDSLLQESGSLNWSGKLKISYSGGEAWKLGISRHATVDIRIEVIPSLYCGDYSVTPVEKGDGEHFELSLDVNNQTKFDVGWRFQMNTGSAFPEEINILHVEQTRRATLELEKVDEPECDAKKTNCDLFTEKLLDLVKLRWEISELHISGVVNLNGLKLTDGFMNIMRRNHLTLEMSVNEVKVMKGDVVPCEASKPVFFTVKVLNTSEKDVNSSILSIEPFEVDHDCGENFDVKQKICWLGSTSTVLSEIKAKSSVEHTCGLLFLYPGQFHVNVKCFERVVTAAEQPFRNRAHAIKDTSPGNRHSRSSRTDSFTDSLLLRQRSRSTPLVQLNYSLLFDVTEDPCTVVEEDIELAENTTLIPEKNSHTPEDDTRTPENENYMPENSTHFSENDNSIPKSDNSATDSGSFSPETRSLISGKSSSSVDKEEDMRDDKGNIMIAKCNAGEIGLTGDNEGCDNDQVRDTCEEEVSCSSDTEVKMDLKDETKDNIGCVEDKSSLKTEELVVLAESSEACAKDVESDTDCRKEFDIESIEMSKESSAELKPKPKVKDRILANAGSSSKEELNEPETTQESCEEGNEQETLVKSASIKDRIMFFNSS